MSTIIKAIVIFWLGVVPVGFLVLMFGPMFAKPEPIPVAVEHKCTLDQLLDEVPC